jgi:hypothetical protein
MVLDGLFFIGAVSAGWCGSEGFAVMEQNVDEKA